MKWKLWLPVVSVVVLAIVVVVGLSSGYRTITPATNTTTSQPQTPPGNDVFVPAITADQFNHLTLKDLPSTLPYGYAESAGIYKDHLYIPAINHILKYDLQGNLVGYSDPQTFNCSDDAPSIIAIANNTLYAACWGTGIYEINLATNRAVYLFDANTGLNKFQNLYPKVDGNSLWVATFNGVIRINRATRVVEEYNKMFDTTCPDDNLRLSILKGDVWATSLAGCGAAEYNTTNNTWTSYSPSAFNQTNNDRVDFSNFIVSSAGVFASHQDGGPEHTVLSQFDPATKTWKKVTETNWDNQELFATYLPAPETYQDSYATTDASATTWHMKTADGQKLITIADRNYSFISPLEGDRYFLLSSLGIEQLVKGQAFPELLSPQIVANSGARLFVSTDGQILVGMSDDINEMGGDWNFTNINVYDRETGQGFATTLRATTGDTIPLVGLLKDSSSYTSVRTGSILVIKESGQDILKIDLEKKTASIVSNTTK